MSVKLAYNGIAVGVGEIIDGGRALLHRSTMATLGLPEDPVELSAFGFALHGFEDGARLSEGKCAHLRARWMATEPDTLFLEGLRVDLRPEVPDVA